MESREAATTKRTDIQLWRGVAVLAVMLAHFGSLVPAGFIGVDLFFAVSGFVITLSFLRLLSREKSIKTVLAEFWSRRFWRLVPALSVVLVATLLGAFFLLPPHDFRDQVEMSVWSFFFAGNIGVEVVSQPDYFDPAAEHNWLLHLWSLGVEEQFYLFFPFALLALLGLERKTGKFSRVVLWLSLASVASLLLASVNEVVEWLGVFPWVVETTGLSALLGYYSPVTRAWQFGLGIYAALLLTKKSVVPRASLTWLGVLLLVLSLVVMPQSNLLPGPITLLPMAGIFLLLLSPIPHTIAKSSFLKPLVWLGDRSYSAYLWHWPIWSILTTLFPANGGVILSSFGLTFLLSHLTYQWVERPLITWSQSKKNNPLEVLVTNRRLSPGQVFTRFVLPLPLILGFAVSGVQWGFERTGLLREAPPVPQINAEVDCIQNPCSPGELDVLLVGDSHAGSLSNALIRELESEGLVTRGAIVARHFGCLHLPSTAVASIHEECRALGGDVRNIVANTSPDIVVIYGYTAGRFTTINSGGDQEISLLNTSTGQPVTEDDGPEAYELALGETIDFLRSEGAEVVIVGGTPDFTLRPEEVGSGGQPASQAELLFSPLWGAKFGQVVSLDDYLLRHGPFREIEQRLAEGSDGIYFFDAAKTLCGEGLCSQATPDGEFLFSDHDHVSDYGASLLARDLRASMVDWGLIHSAE